MKTSTKRFFFLLCCVTLLALVSQFANAQGTICIAPDNGSGTTDLPAFCPYTAPADATMDIIDGLPSGTTIKSTPIKVFKSVLSRTPGGSLGGEILAYTADLMLEMHGTGSLTDFHRTVLITHQLEVHTALRTPGQPVQSFVTEMMTMQGQLPPGDPDFDLLRITAGTGFGLPSPGHTTLTRQSDGNWSVHSFFDITYRIDFIGKPGGVLSGRSGSTTGTIRMQQGSPSSVIEVPPVVALDGSFPVLGSVMLNPSNQPMTFSSSGFFDVFTEISLDFSGSPRYFPHTVNPTVMNLAGQATLHRGGSGLYKNLPLEVVIQTTPVSSSDGSTTFDTEMLSLNITGGAVLPGVMIRESPTRASTGKLLIRESPTLPSRKLVESFFDVFTELSVDGGASWTPASTPIRIEAKIKPTVLINRPDPPPPYGRGVLVADLDRDGASDLSLFNESASIQPLGGEMAIHSSACDVQYRYDGRDRFVRSAPYSVRIHHTFDDGSDQYFDTEMLQLDLSGGTLPSSVMLRESPSKASLGRTSIRAIPTGGFEVSSFFDIFTELSVDGGSTWSSQSPVTLEYKDTLRTRPVITSISPSSGPVGTIFTIEGSGFSETLSENFVVLGDKTPIVKGSALGQLRCVIPEGASTNEVSVSVNGMVSFPPNPVFTVLPNRVSYLPNIGDLQALDVQTGDLDGDGLDEIMTLGKKDFKGHITLLKRGGDGSERVSSVISIPDLDLDPNFSALLNADCNRDGVVDYLGVVGKQTQGASFGEKVLMVLENSISGPDRVYKIIVPSHKVLSSAALPDLTSDDSLDVVCAYEAGDGQPPRFDVMRNIGRIESTPARISTNFTVARINGFAFADLDGDGDRDIVCATDAGLHIFQNNQTDFQFVSGQRVDESHPYSGVAIGDLDGDGHSDVVALRSDSGIVNVCFGDPLALGTVKAPRDAASGMATGRRQHQPIRLADVDGDGDLDIVCASGEPNQTVSLLLVGGALPGGAIISARLNMDDCDDRDSDGDGIMDAKLFAVGKFDTDQDCDFAFTSCRSTKLSPPFVSSVSPDISPAGTVITIEGDNLQDASSVQLGDFDATFIRESPTKLSVTVPLAARTFAAPHVLDRMTITCPSGVCAALQSVTVSPSLVHMRERIDQLESRFVLGSDMDGDGKGDIVALSKEGRPGHITLMKRSDNGSLSRAIVTSFFDGVDDDCDGFAVGDLNGDGLSDICVALTSRSTGATNFELLFGDPARPGMFRESPTKIQKQWLPANFRLRTMASEMKDVDGDGKPDIVFAIQGTTEDTLVIITNPLSETDHTARKRPGRTKYSNITIERSVAGSSFFDIFCLSNSNLDVYRYGSGGGGAGGSFLLTNSVLVRESPTRRSLACRDMNSDGLTDAVILDDDSSVVTICLDKGDGTFRFYHPVDPATGVPSSKRLSLVVADLDGDGRCDIAIDEPGVHFAPAKSAKTLSDFTYQKIEWTVFYNRTNPPDTTVTFERKMLSMLDYSVSPNSVTVCDLDGDGFQDIVVTGASSSVVSPPFIEDVSATRRVAGGSLYVFGGAFESASSVDVCGTTCLPAASFSALSNSQLAVVLPPELGKKFLTISNAEGSAGLASPITILATPDIFVSVPPESLMITEGGKFIKPVKRGKKLFPNWTNLLEEVVVQGGFQPGATESDAAGGLRVGISHIFQSAPGKWKPIKDSAAVRAWVVVRGWDPKKKAGKNWSAIQKTLKNKDFEHEGIGRGLDSTGSPGDLKRKKLKGELKSLDPKKTPNKLFAELVALKFNIAASQLGKTPVGFGELVYDDDVSMLDEMSVLDISKNADNAMTYTSNPLYDDNGHDGINPLYEALYEAIHQINRAFVAPLDTASFEVGKNLTLDGAVDLATTPFLKIPAGMFRPIVLMPTTNLTESVEDFEGIEDLETMPTAAKLLQNYPNPFNPTTTINFGLKENSIVSLKIYNTLGQQVASLFDNENVDAGNQAVEFDATNLASGLYFYRLIVENDVERFSETHKMILMK